MAKPFPVTTERRPRPLSRFAIFPSAEPCSRNARPHTQQNMKKFPRPVLFLRTLALLAATAAAAWADPFELRLQVPIGRIAHSFAAAGTSGGAAGQFITAEALDWALGTKESGW